MRIIQLARIAAFTRKDLCSIQIILLHFADRSILVQNTSTILFVRDTNHRHTLIRARIANRHDEIIRNHNLLRVVRFRIILVTNMHNNIDRNVAILDPLSDVLLRVEPRASVAVIQLRRNIHNRKS